MGSARAYEGGTSMAAAVVSGCAALVREHLVSERSHEPSAALVKAMLIAGARWLRGADAVADRPSRPNYEQGFGCVSLDSTLPDAAGLRRVEFVDHWRGDGPVLHEYGEAYRFDVEVSDALPLVVCVAWTDTAGSSNQNTLALSLTTPDRRTLWSNGGRSRAPAEREDNQVDRVNNVQVISLPAPDVGAYSIQVSADEFGGTEQRFALVVNGALMTGLTQTYPPTRPA